MIHTEIGPFLNRISLTDPRILPDDEHEALATTALWAVALADVDYTFALNAVAEHYAKSPYLVKPSDIAQQWKTHRRDIAERTVDPLVMTDDPHEYIAELRANRQQAYSNVIPMQRGPRAILGPGKHENSAATAAAAYSEEDIAAVRAEGDLKRMWAESVRTQKAADDARKHLVLQHEDLAERLRVAHGLSTADKWNGRIPPEFVAIGGKRNPSPVRTALLAIVAEAEARTTKTA